mgnify:FL=1
MREGGLCGCGAVLCRCGAGAVRGAVLNLAACHVAAMDEESARLYEILGTQTR